MHSRDPYICTIVRLERQGLRRRLLHCRRRRRRRLRRRRCRGLGLFFGDGGPQLGLLRLLLI